MYRNCTGNRDVDEKTTGSRHVGKVVYKSYVTCIEKYFIPYFKDHYFEQLTHKDIVKDIVDFELWRNRQMQKIPKSSTLRNFASAWNKMLDKAVQHGWWLSKDNNIPSLSTVGVKGTSRPAFNEVEIKHLLDFLPQWSTQGRSAIEQAIRPLLVCGITLRSCSIPALDTAQKR